MKLQIIVGSIRVQRGSLAVGQWVEATARRVLSDCEVELVDLKDYLLPLLTDAESPQGNPDRQPTADVQRWLDTIGQGDGYVFVTPEYNHSIPGALKNAIDQLDNQLKGKPVAIVSHGSVGGARANEHLRLILNSSLGALPLPESVTLKAMPAYAAVFTEDHQLKPEHASAQKPLETLLTRLQVVAAVLAPIR